MPSDECGENDEGHMENQDNNRPWLAVFHYPYRDELNQTYSTTGTNCHTVLDRVCVIFHINE